MTICVKCQHFTFRIPDVFGPTSQAWWRERQWGVCRHDEVGKTRNPVWDHECEKYQPAADMNRREEWLQKRK